MDNKGTRRKFMVGTTVAATLLATVRKAEASSSSASTNGIKTVSLLQRKAGLSHDEFVQHWTMIHAPIAYDCPGVSRYTLTIIKSASHRSDVAPLEAEFDGIAELYFENQAALDAYRASPVTKKLRDDGATFIGRELDMVAEELVVLPRS